MREQKHEKRLKQGGGAGAGVRGGAATGVARGGGGVAFFLIGT